MCLIEIKIFEKHLLLFAHTSRSVNYGFTNIKHILHKAYIFVNAHID